MHWPCCAQAEGLSANLQVLQALLTSTPCRSLPVQEAAKPAPSDKHLEMMERRHECQKLGMGLGEYMEVFAMAAIATWALLCVVELILAASPSLPFLGKIARVVCTPVFGWPIKSVKLVTAGPLGTFWAIYLKNIVTEFFKAQRVRLQFRQAAAECRAANAARRSAARSAGQPHSKA